MYTGSPLTDDDDVIGDVVAAMTVCDVTGVHPVVLLSDGADLQSAVLQPTESENGGGWRRETRTNGERLSSPRQQQVLLDYLLVLSSLNPGVKKSSNTEKRLQPPDPPFRGDERLSVPGPAELGRRLAVVAAVQGQRSPPAGHQTSAERRHGRRHRRCRRRHQVRPRLTGPAARLGAHPGDVPVGRHSGERGLRWRHPVRARLVCGQLSAGYRERR